ncbi:methionine-gamma-lyase [Nocardioides cavernae]|uniref:homocysteine desulfhydrase n=1 Tax=Nocardioides cavernae TaxID=1921566 RepID=A0A7Y9H191_9ACTN|nr:PLP-dependent transferase [Nocardioides cavernae]NYE36068.1 methionine-gamma-lyase [Nocardioides cavernae]
MTAAFDTRAVRAGREDLADLGLHAVPLDLSTTYPSRDTRGEADRLDLMSTGERDAGLPVYARLGNPTVERFERALADLELSEAAVAFSSGMAALSACLLAVAAAGRPHVVAVRPLYGTTDHLLGSGLLGTSTTWADPSRIDAALRPDTGLVVLESPANPTLDERDIAAVAAQCGTVPLLVDNTFATPALQQPRRHGASIVLHSATKFLGGHGDVLGGVVACDEHVARSLRNIRFVTGGVLHPLSGYLLLRGLATLPLRMRAASTTAAELADRLASHPAVTRVLYPGRAAQRPADQMRTGGALVSFEVDGDPHAVLSRVRVITPAVSLGSVDTLIQSPVTLSHHIMDDDARASAGISDRLLRVSVGLEDVEDLWDDLVRALDPQSPVSAGNGGSGPPSHRE